MTSVQKIGKQKSDLQVFRRWSRKSYAAFASMNQEIKISNINASYNLLVPSKESGFSVFCFLPESGRDKNEEDDPDLIASEIIEMLVIQNESRKITNGKESDIVSNKILSAQNILS
ncbi:hypothetical protein [Marinifilum fragile]|uniref:hypothetical protein n=1 Tax=Marinifilum fragile TaxID=570161 RepID=UPI002AA8B0D6|nr:hypothetical protein [Marinifilum fragile]